MDPSAIAHFLRVGYPGSISTLFAGSGIRASFEQSSTAPRWYRAASEPRLGRALQAMHEGITKVAVDVKTEGGLLTVCDRPGVKWFLLSILSLKPS